MSKIIATVAINGAYKIVAQAEENWQQAVDKYGREEKVGFPNTAYYLPVIYGMLGIKVENLGDMEEVLRRCKSLLPPPVREVHPLPYLGTALNAGMATLFAEEVIEAIRYLEQPDFYTKNEEINSHNIWLGAADDVI
jgi:acetyl-CoA synthase